MKFPVNSLLAGNLRTSETGSLETASSSGESGTNCRAGKQTSHVTITTSPELTSAGEAASGRSWLRSPLHGTPSSLRAAETTMLMRFKESPEPPPPRKPQSRVRERTDGSQTRRWRQRRIRTIGPAEGAGHPFAPTFPRREIGQGAGLESLVVSRGTDGSNPVPSGAYHRNKAQKRGRTGDLSRRRARLHAVPERSVEVGDSEDGRPP